MLSTLSQHQDSPDDLRSDRMDCINAESASAAGLDYEAADTQQTRVHRRVACVTSAIGHWQLLCTSSVTIPSAVLHDAIVTHSALQIQHD